MTAEMDPYIGQVCRSSLYQLEPVCGGEKGTVFLYDKQMQYITLSGGLLHQILVPQCKRIKMCIRDR